MDILNTQIACADVGEGCVGMGWYSGYNIGALFFMFLFWIIIIIGIILIVQILTQNKRKDDSRNIKDPLNILKERYAKGEITKKEYEEMKKDLQ